MKYVAFSSLTKKQATLIITRLRADPLSTGAITLHGSWIGRRFAITKFTRPSHIVTEATPDHERSTLTLPIVDDWSYLVAEMSRFGASMAARARARKVFEIVRGSDGETHRCHAHHHVCLCGHRGPYADDHVVAGEGASVTCKACEVVANSTPTYRKRYMPATPAKPAATGLYP